MKQNSKRHIAILGSTGSIGTQALEVIKANPDVFELEVLTANNNADLLIEQSLQFNPNAVVIVNKNLYGKVSKALASTDIKVFAGSDAVDQIVEIDEIDIVLAAMVGYSGLRSTIAAIKANKQIALANKETLVVAGDLVTKLAQANGVNIFPVDSEHSAIFQCLVGEFSNPIEKIFLTASGGPFLGKSRDFLETVKKKEALKHPNWNMGAKITIDSSTLMNKGLEVIEAKWLFHLKPEQIDVIIHPQSIIHSIVQFEDGSMKCQMGLPDMKLPIQYALGYPKRIRSNFKRFDFLDYPSLSFQPVDVKTFRNLALAFQALEKGGNMPCILNAANEIVVESFLIDQIGFMEMPELIEVCMNEIKFVENPDYHDYVEADIAARELAVKLVKKLKRAG